MCRNTQGHYKSSLMEGLSSTEGAKLQRLVMLSELTTKDVEKFEFIEITPARGKAYYNGDLDVVVIHYRDYMRVYYDRIIEHGKTASSFNKSIINRTT
jgi:hypothetical protein